MDNNLSDDAIFAHRIFAEQMRLNGGRYDHDCGYHMKQWYGIAKAAQTLNTTVDRLICARFAATDPEVVRQMTPSKIYKPLNVARANLNAYTPRQCADYPASLIAQKVQLNGMLQRGLPAQYKSLIDVLADPNQPYAAWFRIILPEVFDERIKKWYLPEAQELYESDPEFRRFIEEGVDGLYTERITAGIL